MYLVSEGQPSFKLVSNLRKMRYRELKIWELK